MPLKKIKAKKNVDLALLSTLKLGGRAKYFFWVENTLELSRLIQTLGEPFYLLGRGSNLLIKNKLISKPVIKLGRGFWVIKKKGKLWEVGASTLLSFLLEYCRQNDLSGLERLAGMPATVGGMLATNASSFGASIFDCLKQVEVMDKKGNVYKINKKDITYSYRYSSLKEKIILKGYFNFFKKNYEVGKTIENTFSERLKLQDFSLPSCGSVFKNPGPVAAGRLIEEVGLKGKVKGGVKISQKHANFILNLGKGTYQEADFLLKLTRDLVFKKKGFLLEEEIERWG